MMKMLSAIALFFVLTACGGAKSAEQPTEKFTENFIGKYQWESSEFITRGMKEPKVSNPESRGYTIILDVKEGEIDIIKNDKKVATVPYKMVESSNNQRIIHVQIPQDDFPFYISSGPIVFNNNQLIIQGGYNDAGENQAYKRIK